eukprot:CAMPEP_0201493212 /NCGR_PEP_ID=MMETSP0151_2-20130828/36282_1 /ASSEMBLY_ACC=CAM_ASM_000257 /TAXON_ID=200890 /ORGANISM="Paramoeba atlantica, Strain 621/1 / CCAP 1560/9" /LENGTH=90 /DNA_ID=CAMNT_0047880421 /DNA_START=81 /DNA_END=349 /DNA_ORIENTATION=+
MGISLLSFQDLDCSLSVAGFPVMSIFGLHTIIASQLESIFLKYLIFPQEISISLFKEEEEEGEEGERRRRERGNKRIKMWGRNGLCVDGG